MNFLAHLVLAPDTPEGMVGSLAPDLIRGPLPRDMDPQVFDAAMEHRAIDRATDTHPAFIRFQQQLRPAHHRFAGIVADVLLDHILARDWHRLGDGHPLTAYTRRVGQTLVAHHHLMPQRMRWITQRMAEQDWLAGYATTDGIRLTLQRMSRRFSQRLRTRIDLAPAAETIAHQPAWIESAFHDIWPDLTRLVQRRRLTAHPPLPTHP